MVEDKVVTKRFSGAELTKSTEVGTFRVKKLSKLANKIERAAKRVKSNAIMSTCSSVPVEDFVEQSLTTTLSDATTYEDQLKKYNLVAHMAHNSSVIELLN